MKIIKFLIILVVVIPVLLAGGTLAAIQYVDWNSQKPFLEGFIKSKSGYTVNLEGDLTLKAFPTPKFSVEEISVSSFNGSQDIFAAKNISIELSLHKLLALGIGVNKFTIENPSIYLHRDIKGVASWQPKRIRHSAKKNASLGALTSIGDVVLSNGSFLFEDDLNGKRYELSELQLNIGGKNLDSTEIKYSALLNDVPLNGSINTDLSDLDNVPIDAMSIVGKTTTTMVGKLISLSNSPTYRGNITIDGEDLFNNYYKIENIPVEQASINFPVNFESKIYATQSKLAIENFATKLGKKEDSIEFGGNIFVVQGKNNQRKLDAKINFNDALDLNKLGVCNLSSNITTEASVADKRGKSRWSNELIDLSFMKHISADAKINIPGLVCDNQQLGNIALLTSIKSGVLNIEEFRVDEGEGFIKLSGKLNSKSPVSGSFLIKGSKLPAEKFMRSQSYKAPLEIDSNFNFKGNSIAEWVSSLNGVLGVNSTNLMVEQGSLGNLTSLASNVFKHGSRVTNYQKGKIETLFTITNGVARSEKFEITSGKTFITGTGKADLYNWAINFRLEPKGELVGKLNVSIPVVIKGSLSSPIIAPDATSAEGLGAGIGTAIGGPVGAGIGAVVGGMVGDALEKEKDKNPDKLNPLNILKDGGLEDSFNKLLNNKK